MAYAVRMPQLGMNMEVGSVVEWAVDEGDSFDDGELIAVIESEKTTNDIQAREAGILLEKFVEVSEEVPPGYPIGYVGSEEDEIPDDVRAELSQVAEQNVEEDAKETESEPAESTLTANNQGSAAPTDQSSVEPQRISPRARSYASENNVTIQGVQGSGPGGAVIEKDVIESVTSTKSESTSSFVGESVVEKSPQAKGRAIYEKRSLSGIRGTIASRMTQSSQNAPQVTLNRRISIEAVLDLKEKLLKDRDLDLSLSDFIVAALVDAVQEYPRFNAIYEDEQVKLANNVNVGVAVDIDNGLITPVINKADQLTLDEINTERTRLVTRALEGEFTSEDLSNGTITISNLGHFDIDSFDPIINPPEVAILGVNNIEKQRDPETDNVERKLSLSLTFDHRVNDGADAARFLEGIADALAHPLRLISLSNSGDRSGTFRELDQSTSIERAAVAQSDGGLTGTIRSRRFEWGVDEPEDIGGQDTAPNPVEQFLGSLSSCLTLVIGNMADRREIPIDGVEVKAEASPKMGRIKEIDIEVMIDADAKMESLEEIVDVSEEACYVNQVIADDVERNVTVKKL